MTTISPTRDPVKSGYSGLVIANHFLARAKAEGKTLTQMQVHKLVYIAHGYAMAILGRPLIYNTVHAWKLGPVIPAIREAWGRGANLNKDGLYVSLNEPELNREDDDLAYWIIDSVWSSYGELSGEKLSDITHQQDSPWHQVYGKPQDLIPDEITRAYYTSLIRA